MAQEITFTKQADGTWQGSFTSTGTRTIVQVQREENAPLYINISADNGQHNVIYQPPKPAKDQILSIDIAEGALVTIVSHSAVAKASYIASSLDYYTKDEIDDKMEQIHQFEPVVASSLPTASADTMYKFYFIPKQSASEQTNTKEEWMTVKEGSSYRWEKIGETDVDLSDYVTVDDLEEYIENSKSFKGWFDDTTALSAAYPSPKVGDYAYVADAAPATTTSIYECATAGTWSDSGRTVDTSSVQTFATGEQVSGIGIDDEPTAESDNLVNSRGVYNSVSHLSDRVNVIKSIIGDVPPVQISNDFKYIKEAGVFLSGYDESNSTPSIATNSPFFILNNNSISFFITNITAKFLSVGTLTISKVKTKDVVIRQSFDLSKLISKNEYVIQSVGKQTIQIESLYIDNDESLAICVPTDTAKFYYGGAGVNKGFHYLLNGVIYYTNSSIGMDFNGFTFEMPRNRVVEQGLFQSTILNNILGIEILDGKSYNGYSYQNVEPSTPNAAPFVINKPNRETYIVNNIKLSVQSVGILTLGKIKEKDVVSGEICDDTKVYDKVTLEIAKTGEQIIIPPISWNNEIKKDECVVIGDTTDSLTFCYGSYTPKDYGFAYRNSTGKWANSGNSLGVDVNVTFVKKQSIYKNKKISILGDSISTFDGWIPSDNLTYYPSGTVQSVQDTWWKKLIDALGLVLDTNNSWSGSRVTTTNGETSAGCMTRCQNLGEPDVIIVWMGINDFNNEVQLGTYDGKNIVPSVTTTFREAYGIMLNKILTSYPKAEVWVCTLPQCERNSTTEFPEINGNGVALVDFNIAIEELARAFGVKVLDHNRCGLTYQNMSIYNPDQLHPNKYGHSLIANNDIWQMDNSVKLLNNIINI